MTYITEACFQKSKIKSVAFSFIEFNAKYNQIAKCGENMKYFITGAQRKIKGGTDYYEFQKGQKRKDKKRVHFKRDSLLLSAELFEEIKLGKFFPDFDRYGENVITREIWEEVLGKIENIRREASEKKQEEGKEGIQEEKSETLEILEELALWANKNFAGYDYFLLLGL